MCQCRVISFLPTLNCCNMVRGFEYRPGAGLLIESHDRIKLEPVWQIYCRHLGRVVWKNLYVQYQIFIFYCMCWESQNQTWDVFFVNLICFWNKLTPRFCSLWEQRIRCLPLSYIGFITLWFIIYDSFYFGNTLLH